jgi:hypothetical protein
MSDLLDWLISQFSIDTNRVYLAGASEGGHAVWDLIGRRPGFFAAARILAGWQGNTSAAAIKDVPLWAFHAADDGSVSVDSSRSLIRVLRQARGNPVYSEYSSGGHIDGILQSQCIQVGVDWLLAQRRGTTSLFPPFVTITSPIQVGAYFTSATNVNLGGSARTVGPFIAPIRWTNLVNRAKGDAVGTNVWSATSIPLQANTTNLIVVTATTVSWAPAFGGSTTFNDTLSVVSLPIRATLVLQGAGTILNWSGGVPPYRVQRATEIGGDWIEVLSNAVPPVVLPLEGSSSFYRIVREE